VTSPPTPETPTALDAFRADRVYLGADHRRNERRTWIVTAICAATLVALVAGGAVNFVLSTFRNAISQAYTDDALRGRIQGSLTVVLMGGPQLANTLHGLGGAVLGARVAIGIGGALTVLAVALLARAVPELWRYDAGRPGA